MASVERVDPIRVILKAIGRWFWVAVDLVADTFNAMSFVGRPETKRSRAYTALLRRAGRANWKRRLISDLPALSITALLIGTMFGKFSIPAWVFIVLALAWGSIIAGLTSRWARQDAIADVKSKS